jgi:hypothetical protein
MSPLLMAGCNIHLQMIFWKCRDQEGVLRKEGGADSTYESG